MMSCQQLTVTNVREAKYSPEYSVLSAGCLDWLFRLFPNLIDISISSNLTQCMDSLTVPVLFRNIKHLNFTTELTKVELMKLQTLYFPEITGISIQLKGMHLQGEACHSMDQFVKINRSLMVVTTINRSHQIGFKNYKVVRLSLTDAKKRERIALFVRMR